MRAYVIGAGINGLILSYLAHVPAIGTTLDNQSSSKFPLGPRILHRDRDSSAFLLRLGIFDEAKMFKIGHFDGTLQSGGFVDPMEAWKQKYIKKTRTVDIKIQSAMSGGHKCIWGWDIGEINLIPILRRNAVTINNMISNIDADTQIITMHDNKQLQYDKCVSTIKLPKLYSLMGKKAPEEYRANKTKFILAEGGALLSLKKDYAYIYFADERLPFNRVTFLDGERYVIEMPEAYFDVQDLELILPGAKFIDEIVIDECQIISSEKDNRKVSGIDLVGRYAKWNHGLLINDTIKEGYKLAKDLRIRY
jgi:DNA-binding protein